MKNPALALYILCAAWLISACRQYDTIPLPEKANANDESIVLIQAAVKISIGGITYENLDARLHVEGYDVGNVLRWTKDYDFAGPLDTLSIQRGLHHYSIALIDTWGVNDILKNIPGEEIWNGRTNGPGPVTYTLGGTGNSKKLKMTITSYEVDSPAGPVARMDSRVLYYYDNDGGLESIRHENFNAQIFQFEEDRTQMFSYIGNKVSRIISTRNGQPLAQYDYINGSSNSITETNFESGIVTMLSIEGHSNTTPADSTYTIDYKFSNGNQLLYEFEYDFNNILSDKTTMSGQVCNTGRYTYDKHVNPFRQLGYKDFNFQNWSANNRLVEGVEFLACSFPTLVPLFHTYTYDLDGYPTRRITTYKSSVSGEQKVRLSKINYFYE